MAAGDPDPITTPRVAEALVGGGADIIELGIPFSDPIADGPTIQAASGRALTAGMTPRMALRIAGEVGELGVPVVLLTYYNPIYRMGLERFLDAAGASGVDGVVVPDLPVEEGAGLRELAAARGIDTILLAAPSTPEERMRHIAERTSGFLYLVAVYGVTGARKRVEELTVGMIRRALAATARRVPLAVGFGISRPEHVETVLGSGADAAIVGSGFVEIIERLRGDEDAMLAALEGCARSLKAATLKKTISR